MNAETLAVFIKEPSRLYQLSFQELKTLAMQYPYAQNLQVLLLEKSLMDHHAEADRLLEKAAAYVPDRTALYQKLKAYRSGSEAVESSWLTTEGEVLILKDLQSLQPLEKAELPIDEKVPVSQIEWQVQVTSAEPDFFVEDPLVDEVPPTVELPAVTLPPTPPDRSYLANIAGIAASGMAASDAIKQAVPTPLNEQTAHSEPPAIETPVGAPLSKKHFESWRKMQQPPLPRPVLAPRPAAELQPGTPAAEQAAKPGDTTDPIKAIVHKSVTDNEGIASETLADLLARQGAVDRAAKMYERLMLIFPEKSAYFAAKIEQLKKI